MWKPFPYWFFRFHKTWLQRNFICFLVLNRYLWPCSWLKPFMLFVYEVKFFFLLKGPMRNLIDMSFSRNWALNLGVCTHKCFSDRFRFKKVLISHLSRVEHLHEPLSLCFSDLEQVLVQDPLPLKFGFLFLHV